MIVGIDVGNTAIKWTTNQRLDQNPDSVRSVRPNLDGSLGKLAADLHAATSSTTGEIEIRIASVNRSAAKRLEDGLQSTAPENWTIRRITRDDIPIKVNVDHPDRVGIDRLVGAFGVRLAYRVPAVIIDAGTTVTVDYLDDDGVFQGGAILPGLTIQTSALANGTDALPELDWHASFCGGVDTSSPAKNTVAAIRLGVLSSVVGGITRLIEAYGNPSQVVVTGGDGDCISQTLGMPNQLEQHLVCRTLVKLPQPT